MFIFPPIAMLIVAALLASTGGLLIKSIPWDPMAIVCVRSALASLTILIFLRKPNITWSKYQLGGAIAFAGVSSTFVIANIYTTAANATFLQFTAPIFVALAGGIFLGEQMKKRDWFFVIFVMCGIMLFFLDELTPGGMLGNVFAIVSAVCFAALTLLLRKQRKGAPMESVFLGGILAAIVGLPFALSAPPLNTQAMIFLGLLGVVQFGCYYILYAIALKHVNALHAVLIATLEPVFNPLWVVLFHGEKPGFWAMLGGSLVVVSITINAMLSLREKPNKQKG